MRKRALQDLCSTLRLAYLQSTRTTLEQLQSGLASARTCERLSGFFMLAALICGVSQTKLAAQSLELTFGERGVQTLRYNGVTLEDVASNPSDAFHIWHMKATDLSGNTISSGQYGWGENNNGTSWDPSSKTETYAFQWGAIRTKFVQSGTKLDMIVTETNNADSGVLFDGAEIYPFALHFPQDPTSFYGYTQNVVTTRGPGVSPADFGSGVVTMVIPDETVPMYGGWKNAGNATYSPLMTTTTPDSLAPFLPRIDRPVQPGTSFTYTVSLRFTPEGTAADASDAYASFAKIYPSQLNWTDRRILGTAYLASSPAGGGDETQPGGFATNPRRYFNDASVDVTTTKGLQAFQDRLLAQAVSNVTNARNLNGQGVITWDIEGEQYPMNTSYVCSPDQIAAVAPEMESAVLNPSSPFYGQKLDDAYFKTMTQAGLKVGVCIRPQLFALNSNGTASQNFLPTIGAIAANLENKARFANARWAATVFYVDSTVDAYGGTLDPAIFQQLSTDMPGFLFIPEESTPRYYAYTAPFYSFFFHGALGTDSSVYNYYPNAFGANLINDVSAPSLAAAQPQLTQAVSKGDILMGHADWWQPNDPVLLAIYQAAGKASLPPIQVTPTIQWSTPASITYGTPLTTAQLNASASTIGSYIYAPGFGTVLSAGINKLLVSFTPADSTSYAQTTASVSLNVAQANPVVSWSAPASIVQGMALSGAQLNATADVPGTFTYLPSEGTVLNAGSTTLQVTFTPADAQNYATATATMNLSVTAKMPVTPILSWATPTPVVFGTLLSAAQLNATANAQGSFTYSPAAGTVLKAGTTTLTATFVPTDKASFSSATTTTTLVITQATPILRWSAPAAITQGTALSATQLNATANVAGTFNYAPGVGTNLNAGANVLRGTFTPTDATDYTSASSTVNLIVSAKVQITPTLTWATPAAITYGTALSGAQLNASANVSGTISYAPGFGAVLSAGSQTLTATFTPSDQNTYKIVSRSVRLTVNKVVPSLTWGTPASITQGTALSGIQLNAAASVPGSFAYTPSSGTLLSSGTQKLSVVFTPADTTDYTTSTASALLTVNVAQATVGPLYIVSPSATSTVSGVITVSGQCSLALDSAGTFLMVDGQEIGTRRVTSGPFLYGLDTRTLSNGVHNLQLWGHDIGNNTTLSPIVQVMVQN